MIDGSWSAWVRAYRLVLGALPADVPRDRRDEMARTLSDMANAAPSPNARGRAIARAYGALPLFFLREWGETGLEMVAYSKDRPRKNQHTNERGWVGMMRQFRYGLRCLRKSPAFFAATVLLMGLGVGAVTTVFSLVDHVLLRPLPYPAEDRLVYMENGSHSGPLMREMDTVEGFEAWTAGFSQDGNLISPSGSPIQIRTAEVTPSFFSLFGARPTVGRLLVPGDSDDVLVAVTTHDAWQTLWGGAPNLVGSTVELDGGVIRIVGILEKGWTPPSAVVGSSVDLIMPVDWTDPMLAQPTTHRHQIVGRLGDGVSLAAAEQQIEVVARRVDSAFPDEELYRSEGGPSLPLVLLRDQTVGQARSGLNFLFAAVGLLLLVACANVAHLFLARGISRQKELAVRRALGASVGNLTGQLATEALLVGAAGGVVGLGLASLSLAAFRPWMMDALPRGGTVSMDLRVLLFALVISVVAALVFGLLPTVRSLGRDVINELRGGGTGITGDRKVRLFRGSLVIFEVALSLVLLACSGLMLRSFLTTTAIEPGVRVTNTWVVPVNFPEEPADYVVAMSEIQEVVEALPGVVQVTYGMEAPFQWVGGRRCCWSSSLLAGPDTEAVSRVSLHTVELGFLKTYGIDLKAGRVWGPSEVEQTPFAGVISEGLALRVFGSAQAAVDQTVSLAGDRAITVMGVASDIQYYGLDRPADVAIYLPVEKLPFGMDIGAFGIQVREVTPNLGADIRRAIWSVRPNLPLPMVIPLRQWVDESSATRRFGAMLTLLFGGLALLLAAGGLYGTLLHGVNQRSRELGIRLALGAQSEQIRRLVVNQGVRLTAAGVVVGVGLVWYLQALMEGFIYGIPSFDWISLSLAAAALMGTAFVASWLPALRAGRTDPTQTLSAE